MSDQNKQGLGIATTGLWRDYIVESADASKRQQIVNAVGLRLAGILIGSGYKTDLGNNVFLWRPTLLEDSELPGVNYRDISATQLDTGTIGAFRWALDIEMQVITAGSTSVQAMREIINDIYTAIGTDRSWGDLALSTEQLSDDITIDQQDRLITGATIKMTIIYDAPLWRT